MRTIICSCLLVFVVTLAFAEAPEPPIQDVRLPVATLVREDVFSGWQENDMERYARAEKNIDLLLEQRPHSRAELLAWKGGTKLYRAILAREAGDDEEFEHYFKQTRELFAEAKKLGPKHGAVAAIVGGSYVLFADQLPEKYQEDAWSACYDNYHVLWKQQARALDRLPLHIGGELLAGLAQSSQRTGRKEELEEHLNKIIEVLPDSQYAGVAKEWKADPAAATTGNISCKYCHESGRLSARLARLKDK